MKNPLTTRVLFSDAAESLLGRVENAGFVRDNRGIGYDRMRILGRYALVYLLEGSGSFRDSFGFYQKVKAGDLMLLFPEVAHRYGPEGNEHWDEFYMIYSGPLFDLWYQQGLSSPKRPIYRLEPIEYWLSAIQCIATAGGEGSQRTLNRIIGLQQVLSQIIQTSVSSEKSQRLIAKSCRLLESSQGSLRETAQKLNVSYEKFRKDFVRIMGVSPGQYRKRVLMECATRLLRESELSVKEVAAQLDFCDEFHFSKTFKECMGYSPSILAQSSRRRH
jgi:AraC-like DNA-binding protein